VKDAHARDRALSLEGAVEDSVQCYVDVSRSQEGEWAVLVAMAAGTSLDPEPVAEPDRVESPELDPQVGTILSELERLAELHARGSLTDDEFQQAKARALES
jgi:hypothetical protein